MAQRKWKFLLESNQTSIVDLSLMCEIMQPESLMHERAVMVVGEIWRLLGVRVKLKQLPKQ